jgi:hypothetical protein
MLKHNSSILVGGQLVIISAALVLCALLQPAYGQMNEPALLLQQSLAQGGTITPAAGVHKLELGSEITLTAVASPGYQFVYWLGDVDEPAASSTTVYLDGPKIVIAVFERAEFELLFTAGASQNRPGGGLRNSTSEAAQSGFGGPLVPEIPEPATVLLLGLGSLVLLRKRRA